MVHDFEKFIISPKENILTALKKIDENRKGFLIVADASYTVLGTLTDGDIRRAFIAGKSVNDVISDIYKSEFTYLKNKDTVSYAIDIFKRKSIKY